MKKLLALVLPLVLATTVWAANVKFDGGFFTAELPDNWNVLRKDATTVAVSAPDKTLALSFSTVEMGGQSLKEIAAEFNSQLKGNGASGDDKKGYVIEAVVNNAPTLVVVINQNSSGKNAFVVSASGDYHSQLASTILNSIFPR